MRNRHSKTSADSSEITVPPTSTAASVLNSAQPPPAPYCFRLPKAGTVDPHFGGSRTFWNQHVLPTAANSFNPPVQSVVRRQPGTKRGVRFILFASARALFEEMAKTQCGKPTSLRFSQA